jgi:hydrogenase maturation protease
MVERISVLGLGNVLMADDALGPYAVRVLESEYELSPIVTVQDIGTPGLDLVPYFDGADALILIDTVRSEGKPGELRLYRRQAILAHAPQPRVSPHDPGLKETLLALDFAGAGPQEVLLVGVIPESTSQGVGMSAAVRQSVPSVLRAVVEELDRLGQPASRHPAPVPPEIWWER